MAANGTSGKTTDVYVSREINVGGILLGGGNPVCIQSMCNTQTADVEASARQCIQLFSAGASLVRLSVRNKTEVRALEAIRERLSKQGIDLPLVADVHFSPSTARLAASVVQKVRVNPGNFTGGNLRNFTGGNIPGNSDVKDIRRELVPLLDVCRQYHTCLRIGVNHGSLPERILKNYGDSPEGMVASAVEYLEVCEEEGFRDVVVSLKSSNTYLMIRANRMLAAELIRKGMGPPIHLGVTEAGDAGEGRIRSAIGIGTLLAEGIGDTIRVSLTEDPQNEIPVARMIIDAAQRHQSRSDPHNHDCGSGQQLTAGQQLPEDPSRLKSGPYNHSSRDECRSAEPLPQPGPVLNIGGNNVPVVITGADPGTDYRTVVRSGSTDTEIRPDYIFLGKFDPTTTTVKDIPLILPFSEWTRYNSLLHDPSQQDASQNDITDHNTSRKDAPRYNTYPLSGPVDYRKPANRSPHLNFLLTRVNDLSQEDIRHTMQEAVQSGKTVTVLETDVNMPISQLRKHLADRVNAAISLPVILKVSSDEAVWDRFIIQAAVCAGGLLSDRICQGLWIENSRFEPPACRRLCFDILQACGRRISRTEYIACPSCGRTRFDIAETLAGIRKATAHLKNLKIAVMGCIVNGPGEMADADYGYVGSGKDRVTLFRGREPVRKHVPQADAVTELIALIKKDGRWTDTDHSLDSKHL